MGSPKTKHLEEITPHHILGISPESSIHEVNAAYKSLILMLHPDKKSNIKWSPEEKKDAFIRVRKAYKDIVKNYNFKDVPEYNLEYIDIEGNQTQQNQDDFDVDQFNKHFEVEKQKISESGMEDPYTVGYKSFNRKFNNAKEHIKQLNKSIEISRTPKPKKQQQLIKHNPLHNTHHSQNNSYEFGLSKIDDFGFKTQSKNGLYASDLGQVYKDFDEEYWEDSFKRNEKLYDKFKDTTQITTKMKMMENERSMLNIDREYAKAEEFKRMELEKINKQFEKTRQIQMERDGFFKNLYRKQLGL